MGQNRELSRFPNAITVLDNGNVGIGTTSFSEGTQPTGTISIIPNSSVSSGPLVQFAPNGRIRPAALTERLSIDGNALFLNSTFNANIIMATGGGSVGIGTTNPLAQLHVYRNGTAVYTLLRINNDNSTANFHIGVGGNAVPNTALQNNAFVWNVGNSATLFATNDTERMRITNGGNVGIGTNNPVGTLEIFKSSTPYLRINDGTRYLNAGVDGTSVFYNTNSTHRFYVQDGVITALTITSAGNVGIGTTTGDGYRLQISGNTQAQATFGMTFAGVAAYSQWVNSSGAFVMGLDGAAGGTERMRISSNGNVSVGTTVSTYRFQIAKVSVAAPALMISGGFFGGPRIQTYGLDSDASAWMGLGTDMAGNAYEHSLYYSTNGRQTIGSYDGTTYTTRFYILANGNYWFSGSNLSDVRLKENIQSISLTASEKIALLNPCSYNMKDDLSVTKYGFIAQEVQDVLPDLIRGGSDKHEDFMGLDYDGIFTITVKAVQEILTRLTALENK